MVAGSGGQRRLRRLRDFGCPAHCLVLTAVSRNCDPAYPHVPTGVVLDHVYRTALVQHASVTCSIRAVRPVLRAASFDRAAGGGSGCWSIGGNSAAGGDPAYRSVQAKASEERAGAAFAQNGNRFVAAKSRSSMDMLYRPTLTALKGLQLPPGVRVREYANTIPATTATIRIRTSSSQVISPSLLERWWRRPASETMLPPR